MVDIELFVSSELDGGNKARIIFVMSVTCEIWPPLRHAAPRSETITKVSMGDGSALHGPILWAQARPAISPQLARN